MINVKNSNTPTAIEIATTMWIFKIPLDIAVNCLKAQGIIIGRKMLFTFWHRLDMHWQPTVVGETFTLVPINAYTGVRH